jgi:hypothetical protein
MWLLSASIILFFIVIAFIIYANWPASSSGQSCGGNCGGGCPKCPCNQCGQPKPRCGCPKQGGCSFC